MRNAISVILLALLCMSMGCDSCIKSKPRGITCNGADCDVVVHVSNDCNPVDESNNIQPHTNGDPGDRMCFFNDAADEITLTFPTGLIKGPAAPTAPYQEYTLAPGECVSFEVSPAAVDQTFSYTIGSCDGGLGNPDVIIGGGTEG